MAQHDPTLGIANVRPATVGVLNPRGILLGQKIFLTPIAMETTGATYANVTLTKLGIRFNTDYLDSVLVMHAFIVYSLHHCKKGNAVKLVLLYRSL